MLRAIAVVLGVAIAALIWAIAGPYGFVYAAIYLLASMPGWPIGFILAGPTHPVAWIVGALVGYGLTAFSLWCAIELGGTTYPAFGAAWAALSLATWTTWLWRRGRTSLVAFPLLDRRAVATLLAIVLVVPALVAPAFVNLGARDETGTRYYRAYFTADFLWHLALTAELTRFEHPPVDPYAADQPLHYYWSYFLLPAAATGGGSARSRDRIEPTLKVNALLSGVLFVAVLFVATWTAVPDTLAAGLAVALALLAASAEGLYAIVDYYRGGVDLDVVRHLNIDAITNWFFQGLTIDGLPRALWYTPQHAMACALGLTALMVISAASTPPLGAVAIAGTALAVAVMVSPFLGGAFALIYFLTTLMRAGLAPRQAWATVRRHAIAGALVVLAVIWCVENHVLVGTAGALTIGYVGLARNAPLLTLALALGPLLVPVLIAFVSPRRLRPSTQPAVVAFVTALLLFYFVSVEKTDPVWVGWRAGQILLVTMPVLAATGFAAVFGRGSQTARRPLQRRIAVVATALLFAIGLPTTAIDAYNAQDIANREMGPGFAWTVVITPEEQAAFDWIKRATPRDAIVQMEVVSRGRETWTHIPSFAQRRMAGGLPISLVHTPHYDEQAHRVEEIYRQEDAAYAYDIARSLRIDYLYVDRVERKAIPDAALRKFDDHPEFYEPVHRNAEVTIYAVVKR